MPSATYILIKSFLLNLLFIIFQIYRESLSSEFSLSLSFLAILIYFSFCDKNHPLHFFILLNISGVNYID